MLLITTQLRSKLAKYLPALMTKPIQLIPFSLQKYLITLVLQRVFQEALNTGDLDFLENKFIRFEIEDCNLCWTYTYKNQSFLIVNNNRVDASIRCKMREFLLLVNRQVDPDTLFFQRRLIIEGDTELGLTMKNLLDTLDPKNLPLPLVKGFKVLEDLLAP
ncbi:MAG: SCP2 domain-containing protein [Thiohalomonadales bacterium]